MAVALQPFSLERIQRAVDKIHDRLIRATSALERAGIPYAVVGGNAVIAWISRVAPELVRFTRDVDLLLRRDDLDEAVAALGREGFVYRHVRGLDIFRDGAESRVRDSIHVMFAGERMTGEDIVPNPGIEESEQADEYRVLNLEALVRTKLVADREKDHLHLQDMFEAGLIDESWVNRYPPELADRLRKVLETADDNASLSYRSREI